jgi:hypothetical protein
MMMFLQHGYGYSVLVGHVQERLDGCGWKITNPRFIINTHNGDCWEELAAGDQRLRSECEYGPKVTKWQTVGHVSLSLPWEGELPA